MAGIVVRDENGNIILDSNDYYLRKVDSLSLTLTQKKTFISYQGMDHSSHIVSTVYNDDHPMLSNMRPCAASNGGFGIYCTSAGPEDYQKVNINIDVFRRN